MNVLFDLILNEQKLIVSKSFLKVEVFKSDFLHNFQINSIFGHLEKKANFSASNNEER